MEERSRTWYISMMYVQYIDTFIIMVVQGQRACPVFVDVRWAAHPLLSRVVGHTIDDNNKMHTKYKTRICHR